MGSKIQQVLNENSFRNRKYVKIEWDQFLIFYGYCSLVQFLKHYLLVFVGNCKVKVTLFSTILHLLIYSETQKLTISPHLAPVFFLELWWVHPEALWQCYQLFISQILREIKCGTFYVLNLVYFNIVKLPTFTKVTIGAWKCRPYPTDGAKKHKANCRHLQFA